MKAHITRTSWKSPEFNSRRIYQGWRCQIGEYSASAKTPEESHVRCHHKMHEQSPEIAQLYMESLSDDAVRRLANVSGAMISRRMQAQATFKERELRHAHDTAERKERFIAALANPPSRWQRIKEWLGNLT